ncbi:monooxygenase, FAD-binding [Rhizorhabdus wittichii RW1]|uniref:Monooxygenase, FAD-binding n=1 Tax=Rhizorhabdus wittichii (strain DSM 6014 / CCUG 31198 / JCM 15750 / NBRC 105917 / EY 4224 / RW1) TaxID=392499 RepID=A0A9J9LDM8_RHIWR|nr:monooxygenase, FAD-binding [Rhizorhabdus wittichii RW1]
MSDILHETGDETDILIVGAGPVGLALAADLARHGRRPVVIDGKSEISWSSRAICLSRRSQEIFDRIGAGPAFAAKGLPWSRGKTFYRDRLAFELEMPFAPEDRHAPFINLQQYYSEQFLLDAARSAAGPGVVRWNHLVRAVEPGPDHVMVEVEGPEGVQRVKAGWVVAADGARSVVRQALGLKLQGDSYEGRYLIADIEVAGIERPVERHVWFDPPSNPGSTVILHVQPDGIWRIDIQLRDEDGDEMLEEERLLPLLQAQLDMMGVTANWTLVWKSIYRAHALTLDSYRHGRVMLAGDAAHLVPIFGVRGLNSGIDDAHNLAWKLALVAAGKAPPALLDSYSAERVRATRENLAAATKSTWFMSPPSEGFQRMRDAVLSLSGRHRWASELLNPRQSTAHVYDASPAIAGDDDPAGVRPGAVLPNLPVTIDGRAVHLHDALAATRFTLLLFADHLPAGAVPAPTDDLAVVTIRGDDALARAFAADRHPVYLVRPDEHVAARLASADPAAIAVAMDVATGRTPRDTAGAPPVVRNDTPLERMYAAISASLPDGGDAAADTLAQLCLLLCNDAADPGRVLDLVATPPGK